jgi:predicted choloylglycine hydrolase
LKISDKIRPIVSGAKDLYETAVHHADYTTAYTAQMEIFNIAAKDIIIQEWNEKDKLNWPILETEIKKHTFLSSLEPSDSHASSSNVP